MSQSSRMPLKPILKTIATRHQPSTALPQAFSLLPETLKVAKRVVVNDGQYFVKQSVKGSDIVFLEPVEPNASEVLAVEAALQEDLANLLEPLPPSAGRSSSSPTGFPVEEVPVAPVLGGFVDPKACSVSPPPLVVSPNRSKVLVGVELPSSSRVSVEAENLALKEQVKLLSDSLNRLKGKVSLPTMLPGSLNGGVNFSVGKLGTNLVSSPTVDPGVPSLPPTSQSRTRWSALFQAKKSIETRLSTVDIGNSRVTK